MRSISDRLSIRDFLEAVGSPDEDCGGVPAAAVAGGLGTALLQMVTAFPQTRSNSAQDRMKLMEAAAALGQVQEELLETVEIDTTVKVYAARNMSQASALERFERHAAIQIALQASADVPLEIMRLCVRGLNQAKIVASLSARVAMADVQLGVALLQAAFSGARASLEAKIPSLTDTKYITSVVEEIARLTDETTTTTRMAEELVQGPPA